MDRKVFEKRLTDLRRELEQARAQVYTLDGAIQQVEWTLAQYEVLPKEEGDDEILAGKQADG